MKQKILFLSLFLVSLCVNAQFTMEDHDGNMITDGEVVTFGVYSTPGNTIGSYDIYVNNPSTTDAIRMKAEFVSAINADGSAFEICFGLCYTGIEIGDIFPPNANFVGIDPLGQSLEGNHLDNFEPGNGSDPVEYVFRFFQIDENGDETGEELTMTYKYDPLLGLNDVNQLNVAVFSNSRSKLVTVQTVEELTMRVYNLQGRLIKTEKLNIGRQDISMSELSSQIYVLHFENNRGVSQVEKVVIN